MTRFKVIHTAKVLTERNDMTHISIWVLSSTHISPFGILLRRDFIAKMNMNGTSTCINKGVHGMGEHDCTPTCVQSLSARKIRWYTL